MMPKRRIHAWRRESARYDTLDDEKHEVRYTGLRCPIGKKMTDGT